MKIASALVASLIAVSAFAAETPKLTTDATTVAPVTAPAAPHKADTKAVVKPVKSTPAKAEDKKAEAPKK